MAKLRFRTSKDGGFQLPPEGTFDLQAVEVKADQTDNNGDPQVVVRWEIASGPETGKKFRQYYTLNEDRGFFFQRTLDAAGVDYELIPSEDPEEGPEIVFDPDDIPGCYIRATIKLNRNEAKGKTYVNLTDEQASAMSGSDDEEEDEGGNEPEAEEKPQTERRRRARPR